MLGKLLDQFLASEAQSTGVFDYKVAVKPLKGSGGSQLHHQPLKFNNSKAKSPEPSLPNQRNSLPEVPTR